MKVNARIKLDVTHKRTGLEGERIKELIRDAIEEALESTLNDAALDIVSGEADEEFELEVFVVSVAV